LGLNSIGVLSPLSDFCLTVDSTVPAVASEPTLGQTLITYADFFSLVFGASTHRVFAAGFYWYF